MSSLLFVRDVDGRALMPVSSAYGRKLLNAHRAKIVPHPAFLVLQLAHPVEEPNVRPVLIGIALSSSSAEIYLIAAGRRTSHPLLYCIVDLSWVDPGFDVGFSYSVAISQVVAALAELIPISSFVVHTRLHDLGDMARTTHDLVWQVLSAQRDLGSEQVFTKPGAQLVLALHTLIDFPYRALAHVVARPLSPQDTPTFTSTEGLHHYLTTNAFISGAGGERSIVLRAETWRNSSVVGMFRPHADVPQGHVQLEIPYCACPGAVRWGVSALPISAVQYAYTPELAAFLPINLSAGRQVLH